MRGITRRAVVPPCLDTLAVRVPAGEFPGRQVGIAVRSLHDGTRRPAPRCRRQSPANVQAFLTAVSRTVLVQIGSFVLSNDFSFRSSSAVFPQRMRQGNIHVERIHEMSSLETLTAFFGWCTVINIGLLMVAAVVLGLMRGPISQIHAKMFDLNESDLSHEYFRYLAQYKIAVLVLNLVPYVALKIIA